MPSSQVRVGAQNSLPCFALGSGALLPPGFGAIGGRAPAAPTALAREGCGEGWGPGGHTGAPERRSRAGWHSGAGMGLEAGREAYRASGVSGGHERTPPSVGDGGVAGGGVRLGRHRRDHTSRRRTPDAASTPLLTGKRGRMRCPPRGESPSTLRLVPRHRFEGDPIRSVKFSSHSPRIAGYATATPGLLRGSRGWLLSLVRVVDLADDGHFGVTA